eukprot:6130612-Pyramimonas_sp.AAC.2
MSRANVGDRGDARQPHLRRIYMRIGLWKAQALPRWLLERAERAGGSPVQWSHRFFAASVKYCSYGSGGLRELQVACRTFGTC